MTTRQRSGGAYCQVCKKCIKPPRARKHFLPEWWTICEECEPDVVRITFVPREESIKTDFRVPHQDIPKLIEILQKTYNSKKG